MGNEGLVRIYQGKVCILLQEETTGLREKLKKSLMFDSKVEKNKCLFIGCLPRAGRT